ncbi:MAG: T9SS type A sorting domain-containing protein [Bacteroidales bacterium]|nr:T9SS type A sorting domain-containing protein [Bacteroidales bacterium]
MKRFTKFLVLIFLAGGSVIAFGQYDFDPDAPVHQPTGTEAIWDLQFNYDVQTSTGQNALVGAETDGNFLYVSHYTNNLIYKFDMSGNFIESFSIPGVQNVRDMAWDGTYFYGSNATNVIWEMDFTAKVLISTITSPAAVRSIAYDEQQDAFWINNWSEAMRLISRTGTQLATFAAPASLYGTAYDGYSDGGPYLWIFTGTTSGGGCQVEQVSLSTYTLTGVSHNINGDLGDGIAGGMFVHPDIVPGKVTLGGLMQGTPNDLLFGYEICDTPGPGYIFFDDFESYTAGQQLAMQSTSWTTWSNSPGSAEDPYIVTDQAYSGTKSVVIEGTNDCVYPMPNYTTGNFGISFMFYVPTGFNGYFNALQLFNGASSEWGMQVFFDVGGMGSIDGGAQTAATFTYPYNTWMSIEVNVDLNSDWAEFFIDGNLIHGWVWSSGTFGTGTLNQLGGCNFYAWGDNGTPKYYFDDFMLVDLTGVLSAPTNLTGVANGLNVNLSWTAPNTKGLLGYNAYRDGVKVNTSTITGTSYTDVEPGSGAFEYHVTAVYNEGESGPSNTVEVTVILPAPTGLDAAVAGNDVTLTWDSPVMKGLEGYNVYRDGTKINTAVVTGLTYEDMNLPIGYYEYYVTAVYSQGESGPSNFAYADITVGVSENEAMLLSIFPVPAVDFININSSTVIESIRILDFLGQEIFYGDYNTKTCRIELRDIQSGLYLIQVGNGSDIHTQRIIIE